MPLNINYLLYLYVELLHLNGQLNICKRCIQSMNHNQFTLHHH